jgi:hypothetical protein
MRVLKQMKLLMPHCLIVVSTGQKSRKLSLNLQNVRKTGIVKATKNVVNKNVKRNAAKRKEQKIVARKKKDVSLKMVVNINLLREPKAPAYFL